MSDFTDIQTVEATSLDSIELEASAKKVAEYLSVAYPNHIWMVGFQGGAIIVKNMAIPGNYGMVLPKHFTQRDLKHNAIMMAGELLERAGLDRSSWNGELATHLDTHGA